MLIRTLEKMPVLALVLGTFALSAMPVHAATYKLDTSHSFVQFRIKHLGFSVMIGRFNSFDGTFDYDPAAGAAAQKVSVNVNTASVDTNWAVRDKHLRSEDFLDVKKFPTASFVSSGFEGNEKGGTMTGTLTLHGVSNKVSIPVTKVGEGKDPWGGYRAGFEGKLNITRKDYGIDYNLGPSAETMTLELYIEGIRQ
jgi:polyisoprenoid-binding protein YceI